MWPELVPRATPSRLMVLLSPLIALALTLITGALVFTSFGIAPGAVLQAFVVTPLADLYGLTELLVKATPLALIAVGLAIGFRANVWNIGAEGQLTLGAICGGGMALLLYEVQAFWVLPLCILAGILGGALWAAIPAWLRTRFNANEILVSLMLTYVAVLLLSYLVHGPWRDPEGFNFPESRMFADAALLPVLIEGTRLHIGAVLALAAAVVAWVLLSRSLIGFQLRVVGAAPPAARYAGFSENRLIWLCLLVSGALAGLAGVLEVTGPIGQLNPNISPGYGFTAIIVAFVGRLHPLGVLPAALLMALSYLGGESAQIELGLPAAVTGVFQGTLLFYLLGSDVFIYHRLRFKRRRALPQTVGI